MFDLLLATRNQGKILEIRSFFTGFSVRILTMDDLPVPPVEETGATFEENARLKALQCSRGVDCMVLADDSGLEVATLGGEPGINSARYGRPGASDTDRTAFLLKRLEGTLWEDRSARFVCVVVLAQKGRVVNTFTGSVDGVIAFEPRGSTGFGYDPVFYYPPAARTFAEMKPEEKAAVSHRGQALTACARYLESLEG